MAPLEVGPARPLAASQRDVKARLFGRLHRFIQPGQVLRLKGVGRGRGIDIGNRDLGEIGAPTPEHAQVLDGALRLHYVRTTESTLLPEGEGIRSLRRCDGTCKTDEREELKGELVHKGETVTESVYLRFPASSMSGSMSKPRGLPSAIFCRALTIAASRPGGVWSFHQFIRSL